MNYVEAVELRKLLEAINVVDHNLNDHGTLFAWATETLEWLHREHARHGDQVTAIHKLVTEAGHSCTRGDLTTKIAEILKGDSHAQ